MIVQALIERGRQFLRGDAVFSRLLSNSGWLLSANGITMVMALAQGLIIARVFGPAQLGIVALVTVYSSTVNQFVDSRVWEAATKYVVHYRERGETARAAATVKLCYLVDALTGVIAFALIVATARFAAGLLVKDAQIGGLIQFYALSVLIAIPSGTSSALLRIDNRFDKLAFQDIGMTAIKLAGVIIIAMLGLGIKGLLVVYLITGAAGSLALVYFSQDTSRRLQVASWWRTPLGVLTGEYRRILSFMLHTNLSGTSRLVTSKADILILGWLATPGAVGLYRLARHLADPLYALVGPTYSAVYPALSGLVAQGNYQGVRSLQRKLSGTIAAVIFPLCLVLTISAGWAIPFFFGPAFQAAVPLAQISFWHIIWAPVLWVPGLLLSMERARTMAGINWLDAVVYVALLFVLVSQWGALGAAVATVLRMVVVTMMLSYAALHANRQLQLRESLT